MSKAKSVLLGITGMVMLSIAVLTSVPLFAGEMNHDMHQMTRPADNDSAALKAADAHHIPALSQSLEKAILALKAGEDAIALSELQKAQTLLEVVKQTVTQQVQPEFVNTKCPVMGGAIVPEKVTASLTREFNGQKIAFCCNGCPGLWDRLTDAQKQEKLAKVIPAK